MSLRKKLKAKQRRKDYVKKRNKIKQEIREMANGTRNKFSTTFPASKKYA